MALLRRCLLPAAWLALTMGLPTRGEPPADRPVPADLHGDPLPEGVRARLGTMRFRHGYTRAAAFSADGKNVLTVGTDHTIRTWNLATGRLLREQRLPGSGSTSVTALSPNGQLLAYEDWDGRDGLYLWDVARNRLRHQLDLGGQWWPKVIFTPDGKTLVTALRSGEIRAWDVESGEGRVLGKHQSQADTLSVTRDGTVVSMRRYGTIRFWDVAAGRERSRLPVPKHVVGATVSPDGRVVAAWTWDRNKPLEFWDAATGCPAEGWTAPNVRQAEPVHFAPDGKTVILYNGSEVIVWDPLAGRRVHPLLGGELGWLYDLTFAPDGQTGAAFGGWGGMLRVWDQGTGALHRMNSPDNGHLANVEGLAFSPDGRTLASSSAYDRSLRLWDVATSRLLRRWTAGISSYGRLLDFDPDGRHVFAVRGMSIARWDVADGRLAGTYWALDPCDFQLIDGGRTLRATGPAIVQGDVGTMLHSWDVATGKRLRSEVSTATPAGRFAPNGTLFANLDGRLRDAATGGELVHLTVPGHQLDWPMAFSPDGALLAFGVREELLDGKKAGRSGLQLWEVATRLPAGRLETGDVVHAVFTPDGRRLITAGRAAIHVWDLATGREVGRRPAHNRWEGPFASALALSPDGRTLATGHVDSTILLWDVPAPAAPRAVAPLTAKELEACWADLAGEDAGRALVARFRLADAPRQAVQLLRDRLRPAQAPPPEEVRRLIADLDAPQFAVRDAATRRLVELGELAESSLRAALRGQPPLEVRRRMEDLLSEPRLPQTPAARRLHRAVRLLECVGSAEARHWLKALAEGTPEARLTQEAKESLSRLDRWSLPALP